MRILQTRSFEKAVKKLHSSQKKILDEAVRVIISDPYIGETKRGDLAGVRVHKFRLEQQLMLLAYDVNEGEASLTLLALGSHENFYRDLKNT